MAEIQPTAEVNAPVTATTAHLIENAKQPHPTKNEHEAEKDGKKSDKDELDPKAIKEAQEAKAQAVRDETAAKFLEALNEKDPEKLKKLMASHPELEKMIAEFKQHYGEEAKNPVAQLMYAEIIREGKRGPNAANDEITPEGRHGGHQHQHHQHEEHDNRQNQAPQTRDQQAQPQNQQHPQKSAEAATPDQPSAKSEEDQIAAKRNAEAFKKAVEDPSARTEILTNPENQGIRGAVGFYFAMQNAMRKEGGGISESEANTLKGVKQNLSDMLEKNDDPAIGKMNARYDQEMAKSHNQNRQAEMQM